VVVEKEKKNNFGIWVPFGFVFIEFGLVEVAVLVRVGLLCGGI